MEYAMASSLVTRAHLLFTELFSLRSTRYCRAVMLRISEAFIAALKSLAKTTSLLQRVVTTWYIRLIKEAHVNGQSKRRNVDAYSEEVERMLDEILEPEKLLQLSTRLRQQFKNALRGDSRCMLPSYNHLLPDGGERGTFLALDVGGSTFRVALVELLGPQADGAGMKIEAQKPYKINDAVKQLKGEAFFDWMAEKIDDTLSGYPHGHGDGVLSMGLAWSFPIE